MTSYASTVVSGFPNMFVLDGPNAALGHNSAIYMIETQLDYVLGALEFMGGTPRFARWRSPRRPRPPTPARSTSAARRPYG